MAKNTSILLGEHFEKFISKKIKNGKYSSASEVIRQSLRLMEEKENQIKKINKALEKGDKSPRIENLTAKKNIALLKKEMKNG